MAATPPEPQRWQKLRSERVAHTRIFDVLRETYQHPARPEPRDFSVISAPDWVNVVALTPDHRIVLVRQFRYGTNDFSLEIPGGIIEAGEDAVAAGERELREESGYTGAPGVRLGRVHPNPAMQNNRCHLVLVTDARPAAALAWDPDEEFSITALPVEEVYQLAYAGAITHAMVLDALLLFRPHWERLRGGAV